jgi:putative tryptophan/tyrosine transport system substrate-binding protein
MHNASCGVVGCGLGHRAENQMRRRGFVTLLGGIAAWPLAARAQQTTGKVAHIAYLGALSPATLDPRQIEQFKAGLVENGLIEGQNIIVDYLWAEGNTDRMQQLAAELARRDLDVIVTAGPQPVRALLATGTKTPIVFAILNDPISDGFVQSLARPGGNATGLSMAGTDIEGKRVEVLKDAVPTVTKLIILHDPTMGTTALAGVEAVAKSLALQFIVSEVDNPAKFAEIFAAARTQGVNGVTTMASPLLNFQRKGLIELAAQHRLPSIWEADAFVRDGGLLSYGPSFPDMYRRSAGYVAKILRGQRPTDLPVEQPVKFELAVNLKTAKTLGLTIPQSLLLRADEVIE